MQESTLHLFLSLICNKFSCLNLVHVFLLSGLIMFPLPRLSHTRSVEYGEFVRILHSVECLLPPVSRFHDRLSSTQAATVSLSGNRRSRSRQLQFPTLMQKRLPRKTLRALNYWIIFNYSMIVATRPEPTVLPPSRYLNSVFQHIFYAFYGWNLHSFVDFTWSIFICMVSWHRFGTGILAPD